MDDQQPTPASLASAGKFATGMRVTWLGDKEIGVLDEYIGHGVWYVAYPDGCRCTFNEKELRPLDEPAPSTSLASGPERIERPVHDYNEAQDDPIWRCHSCGATFAAHSRRDAETRHLNVATNCPGEGVLVQLKPRPLASGPDETETPQRMYERMLADKLRWFEEAEADDIAREGDISDAILREALGALRHYLPPACHWAVNVALDRLRSARSENERLTADAKNAKGSETNA